MTTADELLGPDDDGLGEGLTLPSGRTVQVRGLSRRDILAARTHADDVIGFETVVIARGLVEPQLTEEQVSAWQSRPGRAGDVRKAVDRIYELSGLSEGADKSAVSVDGERSGD